MAKKMKKLLSLVLVLSMIMSIMSVTASAASKTYKCGAEEHTHAAECYELDSAKCSAHVHNSNCVDPCTLEEGKDKICTKDEHTHGSGCHIHEEVCKLNCSEYHTHEDACYAAEPVCGVTPCTTEPHTHDDACYQTHQHTQANCMSPTKCGKDEHTHVAECMISGTITADTVWNDGDVIGSVTIAGDVTITVKGTVYVEGTIRLNPSAICNVTFKGVDGENGEKATLIRGDKFKGQMFYSEGTNGNFQNLTFDNIVLDGGAVWTGEVDKTLNRGTTNEGVKANGSVLYLLYTNAVLTNSTLQNHDDSTGEKANAVFLRYYSTIEFRDSIVKNNNSPSTYYRGGVITVRQGGTAKTYNTEVYGNSGAAGGFFGISSTGSYGGIAEAYNSKFHNNYSANGAVFLMQCNSKIGYLKIDGCEFYNNASQTAVLTEWAYSRPFIISNSYFHDNECAVWDCHVDPVLDLSGKIVVEEDADYTKYLFETPIGVGGALADDSVAPLSDASYNKLMTDKKHLMTEVPTDNYYNPTSKYTIQASDMAKLVWNNPDSLVLIKTDVDGNAMLDVVPATAATTTNVTLVENFYNDSTTQAIQAVSDVVNNVPVAPWFHEGFYFIGWAESEDGAVKYSNATNAATYAEDTELHAQWKLQPLELSWGRKTSDPYCNTLKVYVNNKNLDDDIVYSYQWYKNGVAIEGATSDEYTITEDATYKCVVTAAVADGVKTLDSVSAYKEGSAAVRRFYVAKIGTTKYETLKEAVDAANDSAGADTIEMLESIDFDSNEALAITSDVTITGAKTISRGSYTGTMFSVAAGAELTLDGGIVFDGSNNWIFNKALYEYNLKNLVEGTAWSDYVTPEEGGTVASAAMFVVNGAVTVKNATVQNSYSLKDANTLFSVSGADAVLTMEGAKITHSAVNGANTVAYLNGAKWYIKDGTVISGNYAGRNGGLCRNDHGQIYMSGGTIENNAGWNTNGSVFMMYSTAGRNSYFEMTDGTICGNSSIGGTKNSRCAAVYLHQYSTMKMTGGTICHNMGGSRGGIDSYNTTSVLDINRVDQVFVDGVYANESGAAAYTVSNHPMIVDNVSLVGNSTHDVGYTLQPDSYDWWVTGGIYTQDVDKFCAKGYVCIPYTDSERTDDYIVVPGYRVNYYSVEKSEAEDGTATYATTLVYKYFHILPRDKFWYEMDEKSEYYAHVAEDGKFIDTWYTEKELVNAYNFGAKLEGDLDLYGEWKIRTSSRNPVVEDEGDEEIVDEDVPATDAPAEEKVPEDAPFVEEEEIEILDEEVPKADVPETGDMTALWAAASVVSAAGVLFLGKKNKDEE